MGSRRITLLGGLILAALTVIAGIVVFAIMQRQTETVLSTSLELSLQSRASLFEATLENRAKRVVMITTRPFLIQQLKKANLTPDDQKARSLLQRGVDSFLPTGFSALAIANRDGEIVASAGEFISNPQTRVALQMSGVDSALYWSDELVQELRGVFRKDGQVVGYLHAQSKMPDLTRMLFDVTSLGNTGELAVCGPLSPREMQCFPSLLHPQPFGVLQRVVEGNRLPMDRALSGDSGVLRTGDYRREQVVAAYMPLSGSGLGMVLKTDQAELFHPVKEQLLYIMPAVGVLVLLGMLMLRVLVAPLINKVIASEKETRLANARLAEKETRIRAIFDNVDDGIVVIGATGTIESLNSGAEKIFGYNSEELVGQNVSLLLRDYEPGDVEGYLQHYRESGEPNVNGEARELLAQRRDGSSLPIDLRLTRVTLGEKNCFIASMRDITDRKQAEEKIMHLATHDALTDLPNRTLLQDRVELAIAHVQRHPDMKVALLFIDLDGFKQVNDVHGHDAGDRLLVEVARRIKGILRKEDTVARQGGDEFIVAIPELENPSGAETVADKLLRSLSASCRVDDNLLHINASIGIALYPDHGTDAEMLLNHSDAAMYAAKLAGGGVYRLYEPEMDFQKRSGRQTDTVS